MIGLFLDIADIRTDYRFYCGQPGRDYRWKRKEGSRYNQIKTNNDYTIKSDILTLSYVWLGQKGIYRCSYQNNGWHDVDFYLVVKGKSTTLINNLYFSVQQTLNINLRILIKKNIK